MDLTATKAWIVQAAQSRGIDVYLIDGGPDYKFSSGYDCCGWIVMGTLGERRYWIEICYTTHTEPTLLAWSFLHELGHDEQIERLGDIEEFVRSYRADMIGYETDAWDRALRLAQSSPFPVDNRFFEFRDCCLGTYKFPTTVTA